MEGNTMKHFVKRTLAMLLAAMMLAALSVAAYAEEPVVSGFGRGQGVGFVDEDGDGVCDYYGTGRGSSQGCGQGAGFVDEDGDGVCDYFGTGRGSGQGCGQGRGQRNR